VAAGHLSSGVGPDQEMAFAIRFAQVVRALLTQGMRQPGATTRRGAGPYWLSPAIFFASPVYTTWPSVCLLFGFISGEFRRQPGIRLRTLAARGIALTLFARLY